MNILEEIQNCPVEWKELGEVVEFHRGNGLQKKDFVDEGKPVIHYGQIYTKYKFSTKTTVSFTDDSVFCKLRKAKPNDIIMATTSENVEDVGKSIVWEGDEEIGISGDSYVLTTNQNSRYINYYFRTFQFQKQKERKVTGTKVIRINSKDMEKFLIPIPPLEIQEKIVQILDKFTDYVTELTSELTSRKKQYSFYRDKLLSFDDEAYQVEWKTLLEVSKKITSGGTPDRSNSLYYGGSIPWLRTQEVDFREIYDTELGITEEGLANSSAKWIEKNAVIVAMYGATAAKVGIAKIPLTTNQACCNIEIDENIANYRYVYYWLTYNYETLKSMGQGSQSNINAGIIKSFKIPVPSLEIQSRIVQVLDNFDTVCNDLNIGLPKEIELCQKQYEYFREKLLTFVAEGEYTESRVEEWDNSAIIKLLQWVFGPIQVELGAVAEYSQKRISVTDLTPETYVGVDNLLQDRRGKAVATFLPDQGSVTTYNKGDILIGNIRPYLKKIWFSNQAGGTSGDVLAIQNSIAPCMENKYLYYILSDDRFFYYDVQYSKGSKMPRGNKKAIMQYKFILPPLSEQKRIVSILDNFNTLTNSLSEGLPKEIELRQKQYEYWREQLLNFTR